MIPFKELKELKKFNVIDLLGGTLILSNCMWATAYSPDERWPAAAATIVSTFIYLGARNWYFNKSNEHPITDNYSNSTNSLEDKN